MKLIQFTDSHLITIYNAILMYESDVNSRKYDIQESHMKEETKQNYIQYLDLIIDNINQIKELVHIEEEE